VADREEHVFHHQREPGDTSNRWMVLQDGVLTIEGHDLGRSVEEVWGYPEYEFVRTVEAAGVARVRTLLGVPAGAALLPALAARCPTSYLLEQFLRDEGIESAFWSRVGD
jgi:hypothetical protein